jgi:hypothetical protein
VVNLTSRPLYLGKESWLKPEEPVEYETGWALEPVWALWRREKSLAILGFELRTIQPDKNLKAKKAASPSAIIRSYK